MDFIGKYSYKKQAVIKYANIPCGFDIETSSCYVDGKKAAFMYSWTFGMGDKVVARGRTWKEFVDFCVSITCDLDLTEYRRLIVYVHNLAFEFQFMRKYFNWTDVFAADDRKPIYAVTDLGIEFRDSYILSAMSLELTAKNLVSHDIRKLTGDLDYNLVRHDKTPITDLERAYMDNDVLIILAYISEQIEQYGNITKIPLTNTGRVRQYMKKKCFQNGDKSKKKSTMTAKRYRALMSELTLTMDDYYLLKRCFCGGFTHASLLHSGYILKEVSSIDFTSSYPYVMLSEKYPMSKPVKVENISVDDILQDKKHGYIFDCAITGLHSKLTYESYLSSFKCRNMKNEVVNNGRVMQADFLETSLTNIDLQIVAGVYSYESIVITNARQFYMSYLPNSILKGILELYGNKTKLKGVDGKEQEYLVSKQMLNSVYGMSVTDIIRDLIEYENEWDVKPGNYEEQLLKHNESKNRFLYYPWGVFVTAYARYNLWTGIIAFGNDYVYSDTDSIKCLNYEKHADYIQEYNNLCIEKLKAMCDYSKIDFKLCNPVTIEGKHKMLGIWDFEGTYKQFKTLGAKRYIYTDDKGRLHITIAGLSKRQGAEYISSQENPYKFFNDSMYISGDNTGKNTHTYIDNEMEFDIIDYKGNKSHIETKSGVHLEKCEFTLSLAMQYKKLLQNRLNGIKAIGIEVDT